MWEKKCKEIREVHTKDLAHRNAELALSEQELIRETPILPSRPYVHVFIPKTRLRDMVKETMKSKDNWELIQIGAIKFADLPILKALKNQ